MILAVGINDLGITANPRKQSHPWCDGGGCLTESSCSPLLAADETPNMLGELHKQKHVKEMHRFLVRQAHL